MFEMLYQEPTKIMVFGPGCSTEAEVTAQATPDWNLTTVSTYLHQEHLYYFSFLWLPF